jgi:hypothetical protein
LDPFEVVEMDIVVNHLLGLNNGMQTDMANEFFFQVPEEILHGALSQQFARRDIEGVMLA